MGTSATEVFDLFLALINDWKLDSLYVTSGSAALGVYVEPWLLFSISEFEDICDQSLTYDSTSGSQMFTETLTQRNINVLSQIMVKFWLQKTVQDILQMNLAIVDHDFKRFSEAQNLREKRELYNVKREEVSQMLQDYAYHRNSWSQWKNQIFSGG